MGEHLSVAAAMGEVMASSNGDTTRVKPWSRVPFWQRVAVRPSTEECWLWRGSVQSAGYGFLSGALAHRIAYEMVRGPIPDGLTVDHLCRVRRCCNPAHMELVTRGENARRGVQFRTVHRGGRRPDLVSRTHCKHGHEYTAENTRMSGGARICRSCAARRIASFKARRAQANG